MTRAMIRLSPDPTQCGREMQNFLGLISSVLGVTDYRELGPHRLRDWMLICWQEVPNTVLSDCTTWNVFDICLNWIGQRNCSFESKLPVFEFLNWFLADGPWLRVHINQQSIRISQNCYWAMNWLLHIVTEQIWDGKDLSDDLQFVFALVRTSSSLSSSVGTGGTAAIGFHGCVEFY